MEVKIFYGPPSSPFVVNVRKINNCKNLKYFDFKAGIFEIFINFATRYLSFSVFWLRKNKKNV